MLREARKLIREEDWQRLMIECRVNEMDPDFRFASEEDTIKQPPSLAVVLLETER